MSLFFCRQLGPFIVIGQHTLTSHLCISYRNTSLNVSAANLDIHYGVLVGLHHRPATLVTLMKRPIGQTKKHRSG